MKQKNKFIGFLLIFVGVLSYLGIEISAKLDHKEKISNAINTLKKFNYISREGKNRSLEIKDKPHIIFFFNTECEHCQSEAKLVSKHKTDFEKAKVYFLSSESTESIQKFSKENNLENFEVGKVDYKDVVYSMGVNTFPMCFIYSPNGKLLKQFKGEVKIEAITNYIN